MVRRGIVIQAAPIVKWTMGREIDEVVSYWRRKGFRVEFLP